MTKRKRRHFTDEQKADAVALVREGRPIAEVARELDLTDSALRTWVQLDAARRASAGDEPSATPEELEELKRLRKEVKELRMQRDFLKKAAAFFAQENDHDSK